MAHYDNIVSRAIDYSNRQLFQGFIEFFIYFSLTRKGYWTYHRNQVSKLASFPPISDSRWGKYWQKLNESEWQAFAFIHWVGAFLLRLALFPVTASIYTASRIGLILLNPFTAWANNPRKTLYMGFAMAAPIVLLMNNIYSMIPSLSFDRLVTADSGVFTGLIVSTGMACLLHAAKVLAQRHNAVVFANPRQAFYHPRNVEINPNHIILKTDNVPVVPDSVKITAPKHRSIALFSGKAADPVLNNSYNDLNAESGDLRYVYYKSKENKPVIWSTPPRPIKRLLNAYDDAFKSHGQKSFPPKVVALQKASSAVFEMTEIAGQSGKDVRSQYRLGSVPAFYQADPASCTFKKRSAK